MKAMRGENRMNNFNNVREQKASKDHNRAIHHASSLETIKKLENAELMMLNNLKNTQSKELNSIRDL